MRPALDLPTGLTSRQCLTLVLHRSCHSISYGSSQVQVSERWSRFSLDKWYNCSEGANPCEEPRLDIGRPCRCRHGAGAKLAPERNGTFRIAGLLVVPAARCFVLLAPCPRRRGSGQVRRRRQAPWIHLYEGLPRHRSVIWRDQHPPLAVGRGSSSSLGRVSHAFAPVQLRRRILREFKRP